MGFDYSADKIAHIAGLQTEVDAIAGEIGIAFDSSHAEPVVGFWRATGEFLRRSRYGDVDIEDAALGTVASGLARVRAAVNSGDLAYVVRASKSTYHAMPLAFADADLPGKPNIDDLIEPNPHGATAATEPQSDYAPLAGDPNILDA